MRYRAILHLLALLLATSLFPSALATAEPRPDAPTYARRGPFAVGVRDVIIPGVTGDLLVTIWYPAIQSDSFAKAIYQIGPVMGTGEALREADPDLSAGPYPLIIFSHGLGGARIQSIFYTEHLAAYGFVVMAADHPGSSFTDLLLGNRDGVLKSFGARPLEVLKQLEYADSASKSDGFLAGLVDTERVGVTGHSFGGYTTVSAGGGQIDLRDVRQDCASGKAEGFNCDFVAREMILAEIRGLSSLPEGLYPPTTDPRIKAIVPLAPSSGPLFGKEGAAQVKIPMLIIVGSKDRSTVPERDAYPIYEAASSDKKSLVVLENAGHYIFVEACVPALIALGRFEQCSDLVWDMQRAHDLTNHFATAFFLAILKDDPAALAALEPTKNEYIAVRYQRDGNW